MIVGLAAPRVASSLDDGLERIERLLRDAAAQNAEIVCFPEAYLPGLRGLDFDVAAFDRADEERALHAVSQWSRAYNIAQGFEGDLDEARHRGSLTGWKASGLPWRQN